MAVEALALGPLSCLFEEAQGRKDRVVGGLRGLLLAASVKVAEKRARLGGKGRPRGDGPTSRPTLPISFLADMKGNIVGARRPFPMASTTPSSYTQIVYKKEPIFVQAPTENGKH